MCTVWETFVYCAVMIGLSFGASLYCFYNDYHARLRNSKEISKFADIVIPPEITELIVRINLSTVIRVADDPEAIPGAALFHKYPTFIVISRLVLGQIADVAPQFKSKHLVALVAHELGHIKLADQSEWKMEICVSGVIGAIMLQTPVLAKIAIPAFGKITCVSSLCSLLAFIFFVIVLIVVFRIDEYRADAFAITATSIPKTDLAEALVMLKNRFENKNGASGWLLKFTSKIIKEITHPSVNQRIHRIQNLHSE